MPKFLKIFLMVAKIRQLLYNESTQEIVSQKRKKKCMEIGMCITVTGILLFLYWVFGRTLFLVLKHKTNPALSLLTGMLVYHGIFQAEALPLILLKQPLSYLSVAWGITAALVTALWAVLEYRTAKLPGDETYQKEKRKLPGWPMMSVMCLAAAVQFYYIITSRYLGWDTATYVGTIGTSVAHNSMYLFDGETGVQEAKLDLRYALSSFYMHASVWCQILPVRALYYAKIVQGGILAILANLTIYELGHFLFSGRRYLGKLTQRQTADCAAGMVTAAVVLNFFYRSIYTNADFLLNRALEAKSYCAGFLLPFTLLACLQMWRGDRRRETKVMLLAVAVSNVAVSMSALLTVPALITVCMLPVLLRERNRQIIRFYLICMLPNVLYLAVYLLYKRKIFQIGI